MNIKRQAKKNPEDKKQTPEKFSEVSKKKKKEKKF